MCGRTSPPPIRTATNLRILMTNDLKVMIAGDMQIPYHDPRTLSLWFKVMKAYKPDQIVYSGDVVDFPEYGRWNEGGTQEFMNTLPPAPDLTSDGALAKVFENASDGKDFYEDTRKAAPDADIVVALGNHDIRIWSYFDKKMPELLEHITPESLWRFSTLGIRHIMYADRPLHLWGGIHVHHGVSISKHAGESVRNDIDNFGVSLIRGHSHRLAYYHKTYQLRNEILEGWETGHMMDVNCSGASYDNVHNWRQGFMVGTIEDGKVPHLTTVPISQDYTCYVNGKKFSA